MHVIPVFDQDNISLAMKIVLQLATGEAETSRADRLSLEEFRAFVEDWGTDLQLLVEKSGGLQDMFQDGNLPRIDLDALSAAFSRTLYAFVPQVMTMASSWFQKTMEPAAEVLIDDEAMEAGRALDLACAFWISHGPTLLVWSKAEVPLTYRRQSDSIGPRA